MAVSSIESYEFAADAGGLFGKAPLVSWRHALEPGAYVPGVAVHGWLTRHPVERWGRQWLERGAITLRYRKNVPGGTAVVVTVEQSDVITMAVRNRDDGTLYADGVAALPDEPFVVDATLFPANALSAAGRPPTAEALDGFRLGDVCFTFDADRDLPPSGWLPDADWWSTQRLAHPAWLSGGINVMLAENIAFNGPGWVHAGVQAHHLAPIEHLADLSFRGRVTRLFDAGRHHFADVEVLILANDQPAVLMTHTIVYASDGGMTH